MSVWNFKQKVIFFKMPLILRFYFQQWEQKDNSARLLNLSYIVKTE